MAFEIKVIDTFITECKESGKEITYDNFAPINESLNSDVQVPIEIFEAYLKYSDISGTEMVTLMEFEKIKTFSEFVDDKKANGDDAEISNDDAAEEPAAEEPAAEEPAAEEPAAEEPAAEEPAAEEPAAEEPAAEDKDDDDDDDDEEDDTMKVEVESVKIEEGTEVQTPPEKVAAQASETGDDEAHQTKVDLETGDGSKTAAAIEDATVKLGEPEKKSDSEGESLVGENADGVATPPEPIKAVKGEGDDDTQSADVADETGDGSKTAKKIEDTIVKLGEPKELSDKDGAKLVGESEEGLEDEKKSLS